MSSESLLKVEVPSRGSLTEARQGNEHRGSQVSTLVLKYSSGIKVSVTSRKLTWGNLKPMSGALTEQYISLLEPTIDKLWLTLMMGYFNEHGMRTTSISACVELGLQESLPAQISISMTIDDYGTWLSTELTEWLKSSEPKT